MGGRGSAGGDRGKIASFPKLVGSEKQIAWAIDIRNQAYTNLDTIERNARKVFTDGGRMDTGISVKSVETVRREITYVFGTKPMRKRLSIQEVRFLLALLTGWLEKKKEQDSYQRRRRKEEKGKTRW